MKPGKTGQPYSAATNHVIVGQALHSPALNEGHVFVSPPYLELLVWHVQPGEAAAQDRLRQVGLQEMWKEALAAVAVLPDGCLPN